MNQAEDVICELEDKKFEIIQSEKNKEKSMKKEKKTYLIYEILSKEPIYPLLEFKKEKRGRRGRKLI